MSVHDVDVAVRYTLSTVDRGARQAVSLSQDITRTTRASQREIDAALRATSSAWRETAKVAATAQRQVTTETRKASSQIDKTLLREVESLRKTGVGYKDIASAARGWGRSAEQTASTIKRAADEEIRQIDRVVAARNKLRGMVGLGPTVTGGRGRSTGSAAASGVERGAVRAAAGRFRSGVSFLGSGLVGGLLGYASVQGAKDAVENTKQLALQTRTLSAVTGMSSKTSSEWIAVTQARDIKTRTFAMTLKTLSTQTENAIKGSKKSTETFKALGITTDDLKKHSGDLSGLLGLVADHLNKMPGGAAKTAAASSLLGRNWSALQPVLLEGSKGMAAQRKEAAALGVTLGGNAAENAKKLEEASVNLKIAQEGLQVQFAEHVAPAVIKVTEGGIKLFGVLRRDLGPAVHFVTGEVKDASHWLGEHKTVLHAVEVALIAAGSAYVGLKVISGTVRLVRGVSADFRAAKDAISGVAHPIQALKGLFGQQESESVALMRSQTALAAANERLAKSFEQVAVASKEAAGGEALSGEAAGLAGGPAILGRGGGAVKAEEQALAGGGAAKEITAAEKLGGAAQTELQQTGMWGMLLGRQGEQTLTSRLSSLGGGLLKGAGIGMAGMLGSQLIGSAIGGKAGSTVTSIGSLASLGAGAGMMFGPEGAVVGGLGGAAIGGLSKLLSGPDYTAQAKKLQAQMQQAVQENDFAKLKQLRNSAFKMSNQLDKASQGVINPRTGLKMVDENARKAAAQFSKLTSGANVLLQGHLNQRALGAVRGIESSVTGSKFAPTVNQIEAATISKLGTVGPRAQRLGASAIVKFTAGMESAKRLPVGSTDRLIKQLEQYYGPNLSSYLQRAGAGSMADFANTVARSKVVNKVQAQVDQMHKTWGLLVPDVKVTSSNIEQVMTDNIEAMRQKVLTTQGKERQDAINHLNALLGLYSQYSPLLAKAGASAFTAMAGEITGTLGAIGKTIGGSLGGWATMIGDFVSAVTPALSAIGASVSSGQFETPSGAKAAIGNVAQLGLKGLLNLVAPSTHHRRGGGYFDGVVPGDPTRDGTLAFLSGNEFVMTGDGQSMMEAYAPGLLGHIAASQAPHFAGGGPVSFTGRASTFGPPGEAAGRTATGVSDSLPGLALRIPGTHYADPRNEALKNHWFAISLAGHRGVLKDIDIGPNESTGRNVDVTGAGARQIGINPVTFPTDSIASVVEVAGPGSSAANATKAARVKATVQPNTKVTFKPAGPGLTDAYFQGFQYGEDPTTGVSPAAGLKAAILGAQLKRVTSSSPAAMHITLPKGVSLSDLTKIGGLKGSQKLAALQRNMLTAASHFIGKPYAAAGGAANGRPPNWNAGALDCSAYVSSIINLGGSGVLPQVPSGWTTDQLKTWGIPGDGRYITVGVRGTSGGDAHTMMNFFGRYAESSHPGKGPHWDTGWSEDFPIRRHPPGLRRGGRIPGFGKGGYRRGGPASAGVRYNDAGWWFKRRGISPPGTTRKFAAGGFVSPGALGRLPSYTSNVVPPGLTYRPPTSLHQVEALAPIISYSYGTGHESRATGRRVSSEVSHVASASTNAQAAHALTALSKTIASVRKLSYDALLKEAKTLEAEIRKATRSGDTHQAQRLRQALALVNQQAGYRTGRLVKAATDEASSLDSASKKLTNLMTRSQIDPASAKGTAMLAQFQDYTVRVLKDEVKKLQKAYALAKKEGNKRALGDIGSKLTDALSALDDATAQAVQDNVDAVNAAKQAAADLAQAGTDVATHGVTMATTGEANLQTQEQLSGTSGTAAGAQQLSDYINQNVIPAMQEQVKALQTQQDIAQQQGNTTLASQIAEQIAQAQGGIMQEQLTAQQAIKDATQATAQNTQQLVGNLGVTYGQQSLPNLAGMTNGA